MQEEKELYYLIVNNEVIGAETILGNARRLAKKYIANRIKESESEGPYFPKVIITRYVEDISYQITISTALKSNTQSYY